MTDSHDTSSTGTSTDPFPTTGSSSGDAPTGSGSADASSGSTSTSSTATTDPDLTSGATTTGGDLFFGACDAMGMCPNGEDCLSAENVEGTFCSPACDKENFPCEGYEGTGIAVCSFAKDPQMPAENCMVFCETDADCEADMTCKQTMAFGDPLICTSP